MSDPDTRLDALEQQLSRLTDQVESLQQALLLVSDIQRFAPLQRTLAAGDLDGADRETARLLLDGLVDRHGDVSPEALERCPASLLQIIDRLWSDASGGRLGFNVQQELYRQLGGSRDTLVGQDLDLFARFAETVAWPTQAGGALLLPETLRVPLVSALDSNGVPPPGHLPLRCWGSDYGLKAANLLMARLIELFAP
jgi:hypothetical protein